jgi:predicted TIM-barrel fold metal-dependent hydrolase
MTRSSDHAPQAVADVGAIDVWAQITTERMLQRPWMQTLLRWTGRSERTLETVETTLQAMGEGGVDIAFLSAWRGPEGPLISNEEVAQMVAAAPTRFRGLVSVDLDRPMEAVREIRRWVDRKAFVGVRIVPWLWNLPPNDRRYYPIYAACIDAGAPVCTQIGHTGPLRSSEVGRLIPYLEDVMLEFPELVVVGGHVGFPWVDELTTMTVKFPNFHVDTSAYALHRLPSAFVDWMRGVGASRVMFGTNWPMLSPAKCLAGLPRLALPSEQQSAFLRGNAARVFGLGPDSSA